MVPTTGAGAKRDRLPTKKPGIGRALVHSGRWVALDGSGRDSTAVCSPVEGKNSTSNVNSTSPGLRELRPEH